MSELETIQETEVEPVLDAQEPVNTEDAELDAESSNDEEESATSEEADQEPEKPKRRSRAEERINALTREKYEAQKAAELAQRQAAEMQQYLKQMQNQPQAGAMPTLEEYGYDEGKYHQAVQSWHAQQLEAYQANQQQQMQEHARQQQVIKEQQSLQQKIAEGTQKYPDFQAKVSDPSLPPLREINPTAFQAVMESDAAVDVAYYLANNPEDVYALASMTPIQAVRAVTQIESKLSAKPQQSSRMPPKPPTTVSGNSEAVKDPQKMTTAEWMEWRNRQANK